mmetsp:Transcript_24546/g.78485  ORF Transcript_24546/g.78485 Transcript_24546/m.78485 type:complete len:247 (+) Transcript_24546:758-1498(+)
MQMSTGFARRCWVAPPLMTCARTICAPSPTTSPLTTLPTFGSRSSVAIQSTPSHMALGPPCGAGTQTHPPVFTARCLYVGSPCMSTGAWELRPTDASKQYLECVLDILRRPGSSNRSRMWEQMAANICLSRQHRTMRFRVWPKTTHANVGIVDRRGANLTSMDLVHLGYVIKGKQWEFERRGLWVVSLNCSSARTDLLGSIRCTIARRRRACWRSTYRDGCKRTCSSDCTLSTNDELHTLDTPRLI